jgi:hypothetical protein
MHLDPNLVTRSGMNFFARTCLLFFLAVGLLFLKPNNSWAEMSWSEINQLQAQCSKTVNACTSDCVDQGEDEREELKCVRKCEINNGKCLKKIYNVGADNQQKAMAKREKAYKTCFKKNGKCFKKCTKKSKGDAGKYNKCSEKCKGKLEACTEKAADKNPIPKALADGEKQQEMYLMQVELGKCRRQNKKAELKCLETHESGDATKRCMKAAAAEYNKCNGTVAKTMEGKSEKLMRARLKGYNKCDGKADKCTSKCRKKAKGNEAKFDKCAGKCVTKKDTCRSKIDDRYPLM